MSLMCCLSKWRKWGHEKDKSRASGVGSETQYVKRKAELCPYEKAIAFVFHPFFPKSPLVYIFRDLVIYGYKLQGNICFWNEDSTEYVSQCWYKSYVRYAMVVFWFCSGSEMEWKPTSQLCMKLQCPHGKQT